MLPGADIFADELDQEGAEGSDTGTADEWLSFCDSGFSLGCTSRGFGMHWGRPTDYAGWRRGGCAFWSGDAWNARRCRGGTVFGASSGSYSGASGNFATVNLVKLTGDSSDRLEPLEAIPVELMEFDDGGRLPLPSQLLKISFSPQRSHRDFGWKKGKFKEAGRGSSAETAHAQRSSIMYS